MKVLLNASNLTVGGGVQVALSLIHEIESKFSNHSFLIVCTAVFYDNHLRNCSLPVKTISASPSKIMNRKRVTKELNEIECEFEPCIVFTVFGPSYWKPKAYHVCGFALGWITNPRTIAFQELSILQRIKRKASSVYKLYWLRKSTDHFVVETNDVLSKLIDLGLVKGSITVIGNTYSHLYDSVSPRVIREGDDFNLITIAHNYPHKNINIINPVVNVLRNKYPELNVKFNLTLDDVDYEELFYSNRDYVNNLGVLRPKDCLVAYGTSDALFLPTLLESFSASYPEAMKVRIPILTSDLSFAHDLCKDSAVYFDPLNPEDIAAKIYEVASSESLRRRMVENGIKQLETFETAESRARKYIELFCRIIKEKK